jgi:hypothetical protein
MQALKSWLSMSGSFLLGILGFIEQWKSLFDLVFVILGIIGMILTICLTIKNLKKK